MLRRRLLLTQELPSEYQRVEWIGASGGQYFITNYYAKHYTGVEMEWEQHINSSFSSMYGARTSSGVNDFQEFLQLYDNRAIFRSGVEISFYNDDQKHKLEIPPRDYFYDDVRKAMDKTILTPYPVAVFAMYNNGTIVQQAIGKLYSLAFYEDNEYKVNLVPCYHKTSEVIGMYDLVGGTFYTNQGTGTFTKGDDVL